MTHPIGRYALYRSISRPIGRPASICATMFDVLLCKRPEPGAARHDHRRPRPETVLKVDWLNGAVSGPGLAGSPNQIFVTGQLLGADRAARVQFTGRNADFGAHAKFSSIGELG